MQENSLVIAPRSAAAELGPEVRSVSDAPLCIDLFCGLFGWSAGFVAEGWRCIGFDIAKMGPVPEGCRLVLQDVLTIHGSQFRDAAVIVASPPCQKYSYLAMPWSRSTNPENSKAAKALRREWETNGPDNRLFDACFRIQREAIEATRRPCQCFDESPSCEMCSGSGSVTRYIPLIVENVRGAQPWVGRAAWSYGSFYLWGDVPALMPFSRGLPPKRALDDGNSNGGHASWFERDSTGMNLRDRAAMGGIEAQPDGTKIGGDWFSDPKSTCRKHGSRSAARKAASAQIAKIPFELARHIATTYYPRRSLAQVRRLADAEGEYQFC